MVMNMGPTYAFHETVRGYLHIKNDLPCEDSSISYSTEDGRYSIAIVADGHGSKACFRSSYGSQVAVDTALECLCQFAEETLASESSEDRFYKDIFSNPHYRQMTVRRLTTAILRGWNDRILKDYQDNPPTAEEMGEYAADYEGGKNTAHIYGTTLIAALRMPKCLLLLHQGDGRCDVFYTDGSVDQPIPWDPRCQDTTTTSLCDKDAADSFRNCVLDLTVKPVMACYLGCDGVEDAYRDTYEDLGRSHILMGGVHAFYKDLTCHLAKMERKEFEDYLKAMLPDFSANGRFSRSGSGDDVSVAGLILDASVLGQYVAKYEYDVKLYELEEALFWKEDELRSKTRKHGILQKRIEEVRAALDEAREKQKTWDKEYMLLDMKQQGLEQDAAQAKAELEEYDQDLQLSEPLMEKSFRVSNVVIAFRRFQDDISAGYAKKEARYRQIIEKLHEGTERIKEAREKKDAGAQAIEELEGKLAEVQSAFEEYDAKYRAIDAERIRIEGEISALQEAGQ